MKKKFSRRDKLLWIVMGLLFLAVLIVLVREPIFTGLFTAEGLETYTQEVQVEANENQIYNWELENYPEQFNLLALKISGSYTGEGTAKVYLETESGERLLVFDSNNVEAEGSFLTGKAIAGEGEDSGGSSGGDSGGSSGGDSSGSSGDSGGSSSDSGSSSSGESAASSGSGESGASESAPAESTSEAPVTETSEPAAGETPAEQPAETPVEEIPVEIPTETPSETTEPETPAENLTEEIVLEENVTEEIIINETIELNETLIENLTEEILNETLINETIAINETVLNLTTLRFEKTCIETCLISEVLNLTNYNLLIEVEAGVLVIDSIEYTVRDLTEPLNLTNVTYEKVKDDPTYDVIIDSAVEEENDLVVIFHHNAERELPAYIKGQVNYTLDKEKSLGGENVTLRVINWNNSYFRIKVGEHTEIMAFGVAQEFDFNADVLDHEGQPVDVNIEFVDTDTERVESSKKADLTKGGKGKNKHEEKSLKTKVKEGKYNIKIKPTAHPVKEIEVYDVDVTADLTEFIDIDNVNETGNLSNYVKVYAIDPTKFNFTNATVTVTAKGTELYKCKDWNFTEQTCYGEWIKLMDITPGEDYTFELSPEDPGFGETINITKAEHLDENKTFISEIYEQVKELDDVWSETIPSGHYVRVTFEKNLTSVNDITLYPRIISGTPKIEVYEKDGTELVAEFTNLDDSNYNKIYLTNLSRSQDTFDLLILGGDVELDHIIDPFPEVIDITTSVFSSATTTHNVNMPAAVEAGDLLLALFTNDGSATVTTPSGWTSISTLARSTYARGSVYAKSAVGNEDGTTVNFATSASEEAAAHVYRISANKWYGNITTGVAAASYDPGGTTASPNPPSLNPSSWDIEDTLWVVYAAGSSWDTVNNYPANYANGLSNYSNTGTAGASVASARRELASASEDPDAFSMSTSSSGVVFTIAIQPNTNSPPTTPTSITCNGESCSNTFAQTVNVNCSGSTDAENNAITYSIDAYYQNTTVMNTTVQVPTSCSDTLYAAGTLETYSKWTIPGSGTATVTQLWFWQGDTTLSNSETLEMSLYNSSGNQISEEVTLTGTGAIGWISVTLTTPINITLGNTYYAGIAPISATYNLPRDDGADCADYPPGTGSSYYSYYVNPSNNDLDSTVPTGSTSGSGKYIIPGISYNHIDSANWSTIGNHTNITLYAWNISAITPQSNIDLRCGAIDNGSNTYSSYYSLGINLTISGIPPDTTPPAAVTNLANRSAGTTWLYWNWTNPTDADFNQAIIYLNNSNVANTSSNYYNATSLASNTNYTIRINTKDTTGNVNTTNVTNTAKTLNENQAPTHTAPFLTSSSGTNTTNENLTCYNQSTADADGDSIKNIYNWYRNGTSLLVLNMPFEGGSNSTFTKGYSIYGNSGVVINATWDSTGGYDGKGAYQFNGVNSYINTMSDSGLDLTGEVTVVAWVKLNGLGRDQKIVGREDGISGGYKMGVYTNNKVEFEIRNSSNAAYLNRDVSGGTVLQTGIWYHVAGVYSQSRGYIRTYINGNLDRELNTSGILAPTTGTLDIGKEPFGSGLVWNGTIDDIKIFRRSLSAEQIKAMSNNRIDLIVSNEISESESWQCSVTPNDGNQDGTTLSSNSLTIRVVSDTTPPAAVTNLLNRSASTTWIYWNWTNPGDSDFNSSIIYVNGANLVNTSNNYYNATSLTCGASYNLKINTKDNAGNVNTTNVNSTAFTVGASWANTSWSSWYNLSSCQANNTVSQARNRTQYDANGCNPVNTTFFEYQSAVCDYCTPSLANTSWSSWSNLTCAGSQMNQSRSLTQYDANHCGEISNTTIYEYNLVGPTYQNTSWTDWLNISCLFGDLMNQTSNLTQYDTYGCAINTTYSENRATESCDYCTPSMTNTSWSDWYDVTACQINDTLQQARNRTQYDTNYCGEVSNTTYFEYQEIGCNHCSYSVVNTSWSGWTNQTSCLINDTYQQNRSKTEYDANYTTCYAVTGLPSDLWNSGLNNTYWDYQELGCNYCSEDIVGPFNTSCNATDRLTAYYTDNNYGTCCAVTGLGSDCHINNGTYSNQTLLCDFDGPPWISIISPEATTYGLPIFINISSSGASDVWFYNGTSNETYLTPVYRTFSEGSKTIYAWANDTFGNINATNVTFMVDITAPTSLLISVDGDTVIPYWDTSNNAQTILSGTTENGAQCRWGTPDLVYSAMSHDCSVSDGNINCNLGNVAQVASTTYYISCQDQYGNEQSTAQNIDATFGVDYTAPTTYDDYDGLIKLPGHNVTIYEADIPVGTIITTWYCAPALGCTPETLIDDGDKVTFDNRGTNYLRYYSKDEANNAQDVKTTQVFINNLITIGTLGLTDYDKHIFTIDVTPTDADSSQNTTCSLYHRLNGVGDYGGKAMTGTTTKTATISTSEGYTPLNVVQMYISCTDELEMVNSTPETHQLTNNIPEVPTLISPDNGITTSAATIELSYSSSDLDSDTITYYVYGDMNANPTTLIYSGTATSYNWTLNRNLNGMQNNYWRVLAGDAYQNSSLSEIRKITVNDTKGLSMTDPVDQETDRNVNATYTITVANNGAVADNFTLTIENINSASTAQLSQTALALNAGQSQNITLYVTDDNAVGLYVVNVTATSNSDASVSTEVSITTMLYGTLSTYMTYPSSSPPSIYYEGQEIIFQGYVYDELNNQVNGATVTFEPIYGAYTYICTSTVDLNNGYYNCTLNTAGMQKPHYYNVRVNASKSYYHAGTATNISVFLLTDNQEAYLTLYKLPTIKVLNESTVVYNVSNILTNLRGTSQNTNLTDPDANLTWQKGNLGAESTTESYELSFSRSSNDALITLNKSTAAGYDALYQNSLSAESNQPVIVIPENETLKQLTLVKNLIYKNQTTTNITYEVVIEAVNSGDVDLENIEVTDTDISLDTKINLSEGQSWQTSSNLLIEKNPQTYTKSFVKTRASASGDIFYSNQLNIIIPGYGGPYDVIITSLPSSIYTGETITAQIQVINQNTEVAEDRVLTTWIEDGNGNVKDIDIRTVYVGRNQSAYTSVTLTVPSSIGTYYLVSELVWPTAIANATRSFTVGTRPVSATPSSGGGSALPASEVTCGDNICNATEEFGGKKECLADCGYDCDGDREKESWARCIVTIQQLPDDLKQDMIVLENKVNELENQIERLKDSGAATQEAESLLDELKKMLREVKDKAAFGEFEEARNLVKNAYVRAATVIMIKTPVGAAVTWIEKAGISWKLISSLIIIIIAIASIMVGVFYKYQRDDMMMLTLLRTRRHRLERMNKMVDKTIDNIYFKK